MRARPLGRWCVGKVVATVLSGVWFLIPLLSDPPKKPAADANPRAVAGQTATASPTPSTSPSPSPSGPPSFVGQNLEAASAAALKAGYDSISHDASDGDAGQWSDKNWKVCFQAPAAKQVGKLPTLDFGVVRGEAPCPAKDGDPIPWPKMPSVTGMTFAKASETLKPIGFKTIEPQSAYTDVTLPGAVDDWRVCFQEPEANKEVQSPQYATAYLKLASPGTACPAAPHTELRPKPTPPSTGGGDDSGSSSSGGPSSSGGSSSTSGGGGSPYYKNCAAARAAGAAPSTAGSPATAPTSTATATASVANSTERTPAAASPRRLPRPLRRHANRPSTRRPHSPARAPG